MVIKILSLLLALRSLDQYLSYDPSYLRLMLFGGSCFDLGGGSLGPGLYDFHSSFEIGGAILLLLVETVLP